MALLQSSLNGGNGSGIREVIRVGGDRLEANIDRELLNVSGIKRLLRCLDYSGHHGMQNEVDKKSMYSAQQKWDCIYEKRWIIYLEILNQSKSPPLDRITRAMWAAIGSNKAKKTHLVSRMGFDQHV